MNNKSYNPDVLSCIANLSSDEVFTPPQLANKMLDMLPDELWRSKDVKFLDPVSKTGVFLREIAKKLNDGLESQIPDRQERLNHIFKNQLHGIAITELTALLSRRSLYCSKKADGEYSIADVFEDEKGNILFDKIDHIWIHGNCKYCGASESLYSREDALETHAYQFIHTDSPEQIYKNMKFDVIIGNPPYQLNDAGHGASAKPIYHRFVTQAKKLNPRYLSMIIPSRWFAGGKGLDEFRTDMLKDKSIRKLVDFENANDCFPGVDIAGGVCYFLWEKGTDGLCEVVNMRNGISTNSTRSLDEFDTFIRHDNAVPIIRKILKFNEPKMNTQVTSRKPFGLSTDQRPTGNGDIILRWQKGEGPYKRELISIGKTMIDEWKVITSYVGYDHAGSPGKDGARKVFSKIELLPPGTICTETYLVIGSFKNEKEARNLAEYMKTKFFRFLVSQFMYSHHITKDSYAFVPILDMTKLWTDTELYKKYFLTSNEINFIEAMIRPMS